MASRLILPLTLIGLALSPPALAQPAERDSGVPTETQERLASGARNDVPWDLIGIFGLLGLLGLRRGHSEDSYHPAPVE